MYVSGRECNLCQYLVEREKSFWGKDILVELSLLPERLEKECPFEPTRMTKSKPSASSAS